MILWAILSVIASFAFSFWAYNYLKSVDPKIKYLLIALRGLALSLLAIVLLDPSFTNEIQVQNKKTIAVLLDASESTTVNRGNYNGLESYKNVIASIQEIDTSSINLLPFYFGTDIKSSSLEVPEDFSSSTNLEDSFQRLLESNSDLDGVVLVSDGRFNSGQDPSFLLQEKYSVPIYSVGLSDTNAVRDLYVASVDLPTTMYVNAVVPIQAKIMQSGYNGRTVGVSLLVNGQNIQYKRYKFRGQQTERTVNFEYEPKTTGNVEVEVRIEVISDEFNKSNNRTKKFASVAEDKVRIAVLAYGIHPDLKAITQSLAIQENVALYPFYYSGNGRYLKRGSLQLDIDTLEAVVVYGLPYDNNNEMNRLKNWTSKVPTFWILSPDANPTLYAQFGAPIQFDRFSGMRNARISISNDQQNHPIFDSGQFFISSPFSGVRTPYVAGEVSVQAEVLLKADVGGREFVNPVLVSSELGNRKAAFLAAFDFYLLHQNSDEQIRTKFSQLMRNVAKWLSTRKDTRLLRLSHSFPDASKPGKLNFSADLLNESGESESNGTISLDLRSGNDIQSYTMQNQGGGKYFLDTGILPEGRYSYTATAKVGNREIEKTQGELSVTIPQLEFLETKQNRPLLERIAAITNGKFINYNETSNLNEILENDGFYERNEITVETTTHLFSSPFWFVLVILLLASEWFLRKRIALP